MHAVLDLPPASDADAVARAVRTAGIEVLSRSYFEGPPDPIGVPGLLLGFGGYSPGAIRRGVAGLGSVLRGGGVERPGWNDTDHPVAGD